MRGFRLLGIVLVAAGMTACASPVSEPPTPPPSSSPTATAVAAQPGQSALPVSCADLVDADLVREIGGAESVLRADEEQLVRAATNVALRQAGGLQCVWDEAHALVNRNESSGLNIWVVPSNREDYDALLLASDLPIVDVVSPTGSTASIESCQVDAGANGLCRAQAFQDGYRVWINAKVENTSADALQALVLRVVDGVVGAIQSAPPARDVSPTTTRPASEVCTSADLVSVATELGFVGAPDASAGTISFTSDGMRLLAPNTDIVECTWGASGFATVVTGGGWAMPGLLAGADGYLPLEESVDGSFLSGCPDSCAAVFPAEGDVVFFSVEPPGEGGGIETLVAAALAD